MACSLAPQVRRGAAPQAIGDGSADETPEEAARAGLGSMPC
jgi:hypothetical protein